MVSRRWENVASAQLSSHFGRQVTGCRLGVRRAGHPVGDEKEIVPRTGRQEGPGVPDTMVYEQLLVPNPRDDDEQARRH
jgi:hypothetical protein